jgi:glutathione reductase (NADPH)
MSRFDVDLFVIGGGSGGVRAARVAAEHGARVAIAEADRWGGTCVIRGCVPKKLLVYASEISRTLADAVGQGWTISGARHDWATLIAAKDKEITRLSSAYADRLHRAGADVIAGRARITDPHTIEVAGRTITAAHLLVATGGRARRPSSEWITSDEAFHLASLPGRIAIMGGGYIAVEFAHIFAGLGAQVTLIHRDPLVLRGFDPDVRQAVTDNLTAHGIDFVCCKELVRRGNHVIARCQFSCRHDVLLRTQGPGLAMPGAATAVAREPRETIRVATAVSAKTTTKTNVAIGAKARSAPNPVATPFPPRKFKNSG